LGYGENEKLQKILKRICEDYKITGLQDYRITGLQDYRITGLQDYRITGLQDYRMRSPRKLEGYKKDEKD
jgi:hypothetical protein